MTQIIGITGLAGSGKDSLADFVLEGYGPSAARTTFAEPIRRIAARLGLPIYDRAAKEDAVSLRFEHFEVSLIEAMTEFLEEWVGEETLCDVYATLVTILRSRGFLTTARQDVLKISPRRFCQLLGTDAGRAVRQSLWIDVLRAKAAKSRADYLLVPDVRFINEANVCDYVVGVERPGLAAVEAHDSEAEIPELVRRSDYAVLNNGTLDQLQFEAGVLVRLLKEGAL